MLKRVRICVAAAGVAAALVVTGCSSGGDDGGKKDRAGSAGAESGGGQGGSTGGTDKDTGADVKDGSLEGGWISMTTPGKGVVLSVKNKMAILVETSTGKSCQGSADKGTITLSCPNGGERTSGRVESVDAKSLKVAWDGVGTDTFQKSEPGKLPTGLPHS